MKGGSHRGSCEAWLEQAGALLLKSPNVRNTLSAKVLNEPNDLYRWLHYLKETITSFPNARYI